AATPRGAISFELSDRIHALSLGALNGPQNRNIILLVVPRRVRAPAALGLARIGSDSDAIQSEHRYEILYDFGLGSAVANFSIRTANQELIADLNRCAGQSYEAFLSEVGEAILRTSPARVIRNAIGRIEVFTPIPEPGGRTPSGPHTHFLPDQLKRSDDMPANIPIPDFYVPCFIYYPPSG
ncbi:MAG: hypothetical protein FWC84_04420, partial [Alphaproteobacteria bacterium]|nr:hypothetical protein [Alphaproteobacteria bacterium]